MRWLSRLFDGDTKNRDTARSTSALVLDVGSSSVGGVVVTYGAKTRVHARARSMVLHQTPKSTPEELREKVRLALGNVLGTLDRSGSLQHVGQVVVVLRTPFSASQVRTVVSKHDAPILFTQEHADMLIARELEHIASGGAWYERDFISDTELIEHKTISVKLNGYPVQDPFGKRAQTIEIETYVSYIDESFRRDLDQVIGRVLSQSRIYVSFAFVAMQASEKVTGEVRRDHLVFDIGGPTTDIMLVHDHIVTRHVTVPRGLFDFERVLEDAHKVRALQARAEVRSWGAQKSMPTEERITESIRMLQDACVQGVEMLAEGATLPGVGFVAGESGIARSVSRMLESDARIETLLARPELRIEPLGYPLLSGHVHYEQGLQLDPLSTLAIIGTTSLAYARP